MTGCTGMTSLALNLPFLRALSLQACSALTQVGSSQAVLSKNQHRASIMVARFYSNFSGPEAVAINAVYQPWARDAVVPCKVHSHMWFSHTWM